MRKKSFWLSYNGISALALMGVVLYFLLMEHREHLFQALPYLILLLCPLLHIFMHGNHGHGGHHDHEGHDMHDDHHRADSAPAELPRNENNKEN